MENTSANWLNGFRFNITSQSGEDGILEKVFELTPMRNNWCVEFGAWDGKHFSNTYNLLQNKGWKGILIEANRRKYNELTNRYRNNNSVYLINKFVDYDGYNSLDNILKNCEIPSDFDFLSIDIDGNDYHVWDSIKKYHPKVVIIEFNPTIPNDIEFVQKKDPNINHGSSILSLVKLGKEKGYELICSTISNLIFITEEYYNRLNLHDNSIEFINPQKIAPRIFQLYDGTLVLTEKFNLVWSPSIKVGEFDLQVIPKYGRYMADNKKNPFKKLFKYSFIILRKLFKAKSKD
jgi:hypothetical protein